MTRRVLGTIVDPVGAGLDGAVLNFIAVKSKNETNHVGIGASTVITLPATGAYDVVLKNGYYDIFLILTDNKKYYFGRRVSVPDGGDTNIIDLVEFGTEQPTAVKDLIDTKITGPASSTNNAIIVFDGATGKLSKNSKVIVDDNGNMYLPGDILTDGLIDTRDIAADGMKLDGVESGATTDQTGAEIKALYEAEPDTNAFSDSDVSLLNSIPGKLDLKADIDGSVPENASDYELNAIDKIINQNTVVDVFIYDTSLDDDGGAWVDKANWQSWYHEALNTTTRGKTKAFPKLSLIVAEVAKVTIYDLGDSSVPMWMVFNANNPYAYIRGEILSAVWMKNGVLYTVSPAAAATSSMSITSFIDDKNIGSIIRAANGYRVILPISGRNNIESIARISDATLNGLLIDNNVNSISVTSDGNMNNTIAVATDGGVSVIHPDFSANNNTAVVLVNNISNNIKFIDSNKLSWLTRDGATYQIITDVPNSDISTIQSKDIIYQIDPSSASYGIDRAIRNLTPAQASVHNSVGYYKGLIIFNGLTSSDWSNAIITTYYNTGFMADDVKGAFLSNSATLDRSVNNKSLAMTGIVQENSVANSSELMAYSGFTTTNYLEQIYNADLDFGVGDFCIMGWFKKIDSPQDVLVNRVGGPGAYVLFDIVGSTANVARLTVSDGTTTASVNGITTGLVSDDKWHFIVAQRRSGKLDIYIDGVKDSVSIDASTINVTIVDAPLYIGVLFDKTVAANNTAMSLLRISAGAPTGAQIKEIYKSENQLFMENARCLLQGTSNSVKAMDYDESTKILTVCSTDHITKFNGLCVVDDRAEVATSLSTVSGKELVGS